MIKLKLKNGFAAASSTPLRFRKMVVTIHEELIDQCNLSRAVAFMTPTVTDGVQCYVNSVCPTRLGLSCSFLGTSTNLPPFEGLFHELSRGIHLTTCTIYLDKDLWMTVLMPPVSGKEGSWIHWQSDRR
jgi:hypothetical protein